MPSSYTVVCDSRDREAWLKHRMSMVTASDVACLFGCGYTSELNLWAQKTGRIERDVEAMEESLHWGHVMEPVLRGQYETDRYAGRKTSDAGQLFAYNDLPGLGATLDAWTLAGGEWIPLELKLSNAYQAENWKEGEPLKFHYQCQTQSLVTGKPMTSIACYLGKPGERFVWTDVPAIRSLHETILERVESFLWHVKHDRKPQIRDWHEDLGHTASSLYPQHEEELVTDLAGEMARVHEHYQQAERAAKEAKKAKEIAATKLKLAMGNAERGILPDGTSYTWKTDKRGVRTIRYSKKKVAA